LARVLFGNEVDFAVAASAENFFDFEGVHAH
jgi:hypothetical protein